ncbi:MAG: hypothetical protein Q7R97_03785 [Candidatus Daviesbacteria bacterium]|nr:hypothetical protein [Candidatus Daviesbacteria bacterium]
MKLPYRNKAFIPPEKINNYLLSLTHEKGKHKAVFFRKLGFNETNISLFENALLKIAQTNNVYSCRNIINSGIYLGKSYAIVGTITGKNGSANIKTVWCILKNRKKPNLVTVTW